MPPDRYHMSQQELQRVPVFEAMRTHQLRQVEAARQGAGKHIGRHVLGGKARVMLVGRDPAHVGVGLGLGHRQGILTRPLKTSKAVVGPDKAWYDRAHEPDALAHRRPRDRGQRPDGMRDHGAVCGPGAAPPD